MATSTVSRTRLTTSKTRVRDAAVATRDKRSLLARQSVRTKNLPVMRRVMLEQFLYFLTEAGFTRESLREDFEAVMAKRPGTKPRTKAPLMPLESLHYGEILQQWNNGRDYTDAEGKPVVLPFSTRSTRQPSFTRLCKAYNPSLAPKRILRELKRYGAVTQLGPNELQMTSNYVRLNKNDQESAMYAVKVLADLLHTMTLNRGQKDKPGLFQRTAWKETLDPAFLPQLEMTVREQGLEFLTYINDRMDENDLLTMERQGRKRSRGKPVRVVVGVYISAG